MKTFKVTNEAELSNLQNAAKELKAANAALAAATKQVDSCKESIIGWLKDNRNVTLDTLNIGDIIIIDGVVMIERAKQNKFDEKAFLLADPAKHAEFKRDFPMNKFKSLVS